MKPVRCAIYTRKSSEEGLEQDFNSLHAQREACAAYIASQASEGWILLPEIYDDGGISGGTLERPALQRLMDDVRDGRTDIIVVYKVDRLTRSLLDFARLVEAFDAAEVSFVSVTQSFNTTTSMGRLTLNMLLSFAQFEREVTAERIRDKIAASKAKGMWMGGIPPLGYEPDGRSLKIIETHAAIVRSIYERYIALGNVRHLAEALEAEGIVSPRRETANGRTFGGGPFSRGKLYHLLKNPIYAGDISHKGQIYPGNHEAIITRDTWDKTQAKLADNTRGQRRTTRRNTSLLAGLLFDEAGEALIAVHTSKPPKGGSTETIGGSETGSHSPAGKSHARIRYRYYVSKHAQFEPKCSRRSDRLSSNLPTWRIPAPEIEQVVTAELAALLADPMALASKCAIEMRPSKLAVLSQGCRELQGRIEAGTRSTIRKLLSGVHVHPDRLELEISVEGLAKVIGTELGDGARTSVTHIAKLRLTRSGSSLKLIQRSGAPARPSPDPTCINLVLKARQWWSELATGETDIASLARREEVTASYVTRVVRLAFLAPSVVEAMLDGKLHATIDGTTLLATGTIDPDWRRQAAALLPVHSPTFPA